MKFLVEIPFSVPLEREPIRRGLEHHLRRVYGEDVSVQYMDEYVCNCHPFITIESTETHLPECPAHNRNTCRSCIHARKELGL